MVSGWSRNAGVEDHAEVARTVPTVRNTARGGGAAAEHQRAGQLHALRQVEARRRQVAGPLDQALELRPPAARDRRPSCAASGARPCSAVVDQRVRRIQLGRELVLDDRLFVAFQAGEPAAADGVFLRGAQLDALERRARVAVGRDRRAPTLVYSTTARS